MNVLVVDDEAESRSLLWTILNAEGYQVGVADGGRLALASVALTRPELILLDVRMPEMDGFEVCRQLKERKYSRDIPVIFLTGSSDAHERLEGFRLGAVDYITKPFQREELLAALEKLEQELRSVLSDRASKQRDRRIGLETRG